jgi:putative transcriptional regulator
MLLSTVAVAPAPGVLLVAKPSIDGGPFWQSVVLLLAHGDEGTLGVIVNRLTEVPLSQVLSDIEKGSTDPSLHFGGPVGLDGLLFLFQADDPPTDAKSVLSGVFYSGDRELLGKLLKKKDRRSRVKVYVGHAGWSPGQLQGEIARGSWSLVPADAFTLFQKSPDAIWPELAQTGVTVAAAGGKCSPRRSPFFSRFRALGSFSARTVSLGSAIRSTSAPSRATTAAGGTTTASRASTPSCGRTTAASFSPN